MSIGSAIKGALGFVDKATIEIIDVRQRKVTMQKPVDAGGNGNGLSLPTPNLTDVLDAINLGGVIGALGGSIPTMPEDAHRRKFTVQFNPNELTLSGYGGASVSKMSYSKEGGQKAVAQEVADTRISMSVNLIFDEVTPWDSFMADRLTTSPTALLTGGVQIAKSLLGKDHTVQQKVEGFIAALRDPLTSLIIFTWGDLSYSGVLSRVGVHYTMFNTKGYPVRAVVSMSIVCADASVSPGRMGQWEKHYEEAFDNGSFSLVGAAQKVGNMLNLNL